MSVQILPAIPCLRNSCSESRTAENSPSPPAIPLPRIEEFGDIIAGVGQDRQFGGSRQEQGVPSAPEKLCEQLPGQEKRQPAALLRKTSNLPGVWKEVR